MPYKIYPTAALDASTAFQIELGPRVLAAGEEIENHGAQGTEREEILRNHLGEDYEKGHCGTAWGLHGVSEGLTPAKLAEGLTEYGEDFIPCTERETCDHSLMVNAELELESQLEYVFD